MIVKLIAHTTLVGIGPGQPDGMREAGYVFQVPLPQHIDELAEFAGRLCYQSWTRPNPATATNEGYLRNILAQEHYSVLEHGSASFYIAGVSRSLTHELVRHRHLSFSQVSQRYVDESKASFITPPVIFDQQMTPNGEIALAVLGEVTGSATEHYSRIVAQLEYLGLSRKEARQAARSVLPNATETQLVVTGNMRAWREVIDKRTRLNPDTGKPFADQEIYNLMVEVRHQLKDLAPNTFQDLT